MTWLRNFSVTWPRYVPLVVITTLFFLHLWIISGFVTVETRLVPKMEQELIALPDTTGFIWWGSSCSIVSFLCSVFFLKVLVLLIIFIWPLYCLSFYWRFWLPIWYMYAFPTDKGRSPYNGRLSDFSFYIDSQISVHRKFKK
jgi:hypothetical protein